MQGHSMIAKSVAIFGKARRPKTSTLVFLVCKLASFFDGTFSARAATRRRATFLTLDCLILFWRHSSTRSMILGYHG